MESRICFFAAVLISLLFCGAAPMFAQDASKPNATATTTANATATSQQEHAQPQPEDSGENAEEEENPAFVGNPLTPEESWQILSWEEKNPGAVLKYEVVVESASA
ncbi:MAG: hypothetical protein II516_00745, partial [Treponema sp.]|nr:hypothetical protein [Treponema sp.]